MLIPFRNQMTIDNLELDFTLPEITFFGAVTNIIIRGTPSNLEMDPIYP